MSDQRNKVACVLRVTRPDMFSMLHERISIELGPKTGVL